MKEIVPYAAFGTAQGNFLVFFYLGKSKDEFAALIGADEIVFDVDN